ncbi:MAG TPA: type 1 glutamine amidotransferase domain-containing protein [Candidatus Saccharimonadales bacterium]|nr:type 1 glutamine amidotransferase domain-containing protein [Candidatus Saccharimonadales bacterium]
MANVAILVDNYFEQVEMTSPKQALEEAGHETTLVTTGQDEVAGLNHVEPGDKFEADELIEEVNFDDYDALVVPGGVVNADALRMNEKAREWVKHCFDNNKPLAVICHGPWLVVSSGLVDGHKLTSWPTLQDDIKNAGGDWVDQDLVEDGVLITSRKPDDLPVFNQALLDHLG